MVNHDDAVAIAVKRDPQIRFLSHDARLEHPHISRTAFFIDVYTIRLATDGDNLRTQFTQHIRRNVIGGTVGAIHHNFQTIEAKFVWKRRFAKLNIAPRRIHDTTGLTEQGGVHASDLFFHFSFDSFFHFIRQLGAVNGEKFDAIIIKGIMRCRDNDACFGTESPGHVRDGGRRHRPGE